MMTLTEEQMDVVRHRGSLFVSACPGAGKTRTIVARYFHRVEQLPQRAGIAVLSFTNAAVDEINRRCHEKGTNELAGFPNFLGTFDSFIASYFVVPFKSPWCDKRPDIVDSWERIGITELRRRGIKMLRGISPNHLISDDNGNVTICIEHLDDETKRIVQRDPIGWNNYVNQEHCKWINRGYLSCADARVLAVRLLNSKEGSGIINALAARFSEIIVDEAQDCNDQDIDILRKLKDAGVDVIMIGDLDQAIFEFRGVNTQMICEFKTEFEQKTITGNFRSSPAICSLAATLRIQQPADTSCGETKDIRYPIVLIEYSGSISGKIGDTFSTVARGNEIDNCQQFALAHNTSHMLDAIGEKQDIKSSSNAVGLATAVRQFLGADSTSQERLQSVRTVERFLLEQMSIESSGTLPERVAKDNEIDIRWLRRISVTILCSLPNPENMTAKDWSKLAVELLAKIEEHRGRKWCSFKRALPEKDYPGWQFSAESNRPCKGSSIHKAKGKEHEAVLLILPAARSKRLKPIIELWKSPDKEAEEKRVLYVAVTRAKKLLAIAAPIKCCNELKTILDRKEIEYQCQRI